jgi:hypothetical protein
MKTNETEVAPSYSRAERRQGKKLAHYVMSNVKHGQTDMRTPFPTMRDFLKERQTPVSQNVLQLAKEILQDESVHIQLYREPRDQDDNLGAQRIAATILKDMEGNPLPPNPNTHVS